MKADENARLLNLGQLVDGGCDVEHKCNIMLNWNSCFEK